MRFLRGVLAQSILLAQNASPTFTHVYASLTSIINSRFPQNGELILRRVVAQFRRSYRRNIKVSSEFNCQLFDLPTIIYSCGFYAMTYTESLHVACKKSKRISWILFSRNTSRPTEPLN